MRHLIFTAFAFLCAGLLFADVTTTHGNLKLIHARATRTPQKVTIKITEPAQDQVVPGPDVTVQFKAQNWIPETEGKHFHFILDNEPFQSHFSQDPFVFRDVAPGAHVIRVFPVYPWHESVKQQNAIAIVQFYVKEKTGKSPIDPAKPMLIYSTPAGTHQSNERLPGQPQPGILVDWFLRNVSMGSKAGYFVQISVDGNELMSMKEWRPHYIQGLTPGQHRIKLELLKNGVPVQENWSVTEHTITVE
jgi:hypothetical protein